MTREEFDRGLHAAPAMVKGRGMNYQLQLIWNCVDAYIAAHYIDLMKDPNKSWLLEWRDMNCPHARVHELMKRRMRECTLQLNEVEPRTQVIEKGLEILNRIKTQNQRGVSGARLLLEAVLLTSAIALSPTEKKVAQYSQLAETLSRHSSVLLVIAGLMKALVGLAVEAFALDKNLKLLHSGIATAKTGFFGHERQELTAQMKDLIASTQDKKLTL